MSILDIWKKRKTQVDKAGAHKQAAPASITADKGKTEAKSTPLIDRSTLGVKSVHSHAYAVLIRPALSEKTASQEAESTYTFVVAMSATKSAIKTAVKDIYGVAPKQVRVISHQGKQVRFGRYTGRRTDWKKALVVLKPGETIRIHEGV